MRWYLIFLFLTSWLVNGNVLIKEQPASHVSTQAHTFRSFDDLFSSTVAKQQRKQGEKVLYAHHKTHSSTARDRHLDLGGIEQIWFEKTTVNLFYAKSFLFFSSGFIATTKHLLYPKHSFW